MSAGNMRKGRNPWKKLMSNVKLSAQGRRGAPTQLRPREVSITEKDLCDQFNKQNGKCYWFDLDINPYDIFKSRYPLAMSVDRLDNEKGYVVGNIVICTRFANLGRGSSSTADMYEAVNYIRNSTSSAATFFTYVGR